MEHPTLWGCKQDIMSQHNYFRKGLHVIFLKKFFFMQMNFWTIVFIVVTYSQFNSNIRVLYVFLGFLKNTWKYLKIFDHLCLWVWAQLKLSLLSVLFIVFTYFTYSHFQFLKYLKILLFEHLRKIRVFRMSLLWLFLQFVIINVGSIHNWGT
jgi:hypothetical protein